MDFRTFVLGASLLSTAAAVTHADDPNDSIGIVNLSDQDVSSELRDCLKQHMLGECLEKQLGSNSAKPDAFKDRVLDEIDEEMVEQWRSFMYDGINPSQDAWNKGETAINYGVNIGGERLEMDEVAQDPYKLETEQKSKTPGIWVKHDFEVYPQIGYGFSTGKSGVTNKQGYFGGVFTLNGIFRVIKRHPMGEIYDRGFWSYVRSDARIVTQAFPMYFTVGAHLDGQELLPGEGFEFERFGSIALGIGPNISLTGVSLPASFTQFDAGIFGSAGLVVSKVIGHFRTIMEARDDGLLRLSLENINQDSEKVMGEISAGFVLGPISFVRSLLRLETGVIHTRETILDLVIDPKYPQARRALRYAYLGFFAPAQKLADSADTDYQGVRNLGHSSLTQTTHERDFQILTYDRGSQISETVEKSDSGLDVTSESMDEHRKTLRSQKLLDVLVRTDNRNQNPQQNRYLSVKYRFDSDNAKPEELREFLDLATILAPTGQAQDCQDQIAGWRKTLETEHPNEKRGTLKGYFYLSFDSVALADLLRTPESRKGSQLFVNWAKALGLSEPESWGTMTPEQQDIAASLVPGASNHLKQLRRFSKALLEAIATQDPVGQARVFTKTIRGVDYDLYPIAAMALPADHNHLMAFERISLGKGGETDTLEFAAIGDGYVFQPKDSY